MNGNMCRRCRLRLQRNKVHRIGPIHSSQYRRNLTTSSRLSRCPDSSAASSPSSLPTLFALFAQPTWAVQSLLPAAKEASTDPGITSQTLRHLLRLSALPPPRNAEDEASMISTLTSQLHFVRSIQGVETSSSSVEPLRAICDETAAGLASQTITIDSLRDALDTEKIIGHSKRPRRRESSGGWDSQPACKDAGAVEEAGVTKRRRAPEIENWNVLAGASETAGSYFVVRNGHGSAAAEETAS